MLSIRVTDYNGDFDTLSEVKLIGPYESVEARETDLDRLTFVQHLGQYELEESDLSDGDYVFEPARFKDVKTPWDLEQLLYP